MNLLDHHSVDEVTSSSQSLTEDTALFKNVDEDIEAIQGDDGTSSLIVKMKKVDPKSGQEQEVPPGFGCGCQLFPGIQMKVLILLRAYIKVLRVWMRALTPPRVQMKVSSRSVGKGTGPLHTKAESYSSLQNVAQDARFQVVPEDTGSSQNFTELGYFSQTS
ncbi:hypothetical protein E2C01_047776 [Portunus trituberculatus]|uniref:Uncharacterized protein n=1 Tax=Portunus trituberculatus TaxID=210409 RepID=A0A5B7G9E6_PORTR|nr:hypothetical protein [Portunus trituberculatus]